MRGVMWLASSERVLLNVVPSGMTPNIMKEDAVGLRTEYMWQIRSDLTIIGDPEVRLPHFCGHMVNDGASLEETSTTDDAIRFVIGVTALNNAMFVSLGGFLVACVALKPIAKDKEVFASYGVPYWLKKITDKTLDEYLLSTLPDWRADNVLKLYNASIKKLSENVEAIVHTCGQVETMKRVHDKCGKLCSALERFKSSSKSNVDEDIVEAIGFLTLGLHGKRREDGKFNEMSAGGLV